MSKVEALESQKNQMIQTIALDFVAEYSGSFLEQEIDLYLSALRKQQIHPDIITLVGEILRDQQSWLHSGYGYMFIYQKLLPTESRE